MIAVIFEVLPTAAGRAEYLEIASQLRKRLADMPGFISIERFQSLSDPQKVLSLSYWENEEAITAWRNLEQHRAAQAKGRGELFADYRIRVGHIVRDYTMRDRDEVPRDSHQIHG